MKKKYKFVYCLSPGYAIAVKTDVEVRKDADDAALKLALQVAQDKAFVAAVAELDAIKTNEKLVAELKGKAVCLLGYMSAEDARAMAPRDVPSLIEARML